MPVTSPSPSRTGALLAIAGACLWGTTGTSQALLVGTHSPVAVGSLRALVAAAVLLLVAVVRGRGPAGLTHAAGSGRWRWLLVAGIGVAVYQLTFFAAVAATGVGVGTLVMLASAPAVAGLAGWAMDGDRPSRIWAISTLIGLAGAALLVLGAGGETRIAWSGILLAVAAGAAFALYSIAGRRLAAPEVDGLSLTACIFVVAAALLAVPLSSQDLGFATEPRSMLVLAWLGVMATAVAYLLYQSAMRHITAATAATLALAEPMVANLLAIGVLHEPFTWMMGCGVALVLAGLALLARA